jgi:hypothetical protein
MLYLKLLEKEEQAKLKIIRREVIKSRAEINEIRDQKNIQRINATKSWLFEKKKSTSPWQT